MPSVLFVCTANQCRSPMAMALFRQQLGSQAGSWRVESAGTWAMEAYPAMAKTLQVLKSRGLDLSAHSARSVSRDLMESFNLILVMEPGHKEALQVEFPDLAGRIYLLSEMVGVERGIIDPVGGSLIDYEDAAREIEAYLTRGFGRICELAQD